MKENKLKEYIEKANKIHNNKYDYSKALLAKTCKDKIIVICPNHGEFETTWDNHVNGKCECPKCGNAKRNRSTNDFITEVKNIHKDKNFSFEKTIYTKARNKVIINCHEKNENGNEHGYFEIRACNLLDGVGCPKCNKYRHIDKNEWIQRANIVHNNKYDYSETEYIGNKKEKIKIICHEKDENGVEHGIFLQDPSSHLSGCGCPKCNGGVSYTTNNFIEEAKKTHIIKYDYSKVNYKNANTPVEIICPKHGSFWQKPTLHLRGYNCPLCKTSKLENILLNALNKNNINFIYQYKLYSKHNKLFIYDYYIPSCNLLIECQGEQHYRPHSFGSSLNVDNLNIQKNIDLEKYNLTTEQNKKIIYFTIPKYFIDKTIDINSDFYKDKIVFTDVNKLISYINQNETHTENKNSFNDFCNDIRKITDIITIYDNEIIKINNNIIIKYQLLKSNQRNELNDIRRNYKKDGYKVLILFEDEYLNNKELVINKISHICRITKENIIKINARDKNIIIDEIHNDVAKLFLNNFHIQGYVNSTIHYGAFFNNELIAVMSFTLDDKKNNNWSLTRFATSNKFLCRGIGGKLFKYFTRHNNFNEIKSFADKRWTFDETSNIYVQLGFKLDKTTYPDYYYFHKGENVRYHKFNFRKEHLHKKYNLPLTMTESEMTSQIGYEKLWNCGLFKYVFKSSNI